MDFLKPLYDTKNLKTAGAVAIPTILVMALTAGRSKWVQGIAATGAALASVAFVVPRL